MFSWLFSAPLAVGLEAPDFTLPDQNGAPVTLSTLRGKPLILVFYPADGTRVCRRQLCEFRDQEGLANQRSVRIYGINPGSAESHRRFRKQEGLPFSLLVDENRRVAALYRASGLLVKRTVYLIGADGTIRLGERGTPSAEAVIRLAGES